MFRMKRLIIFLLLIFSNQVVICQIAPDTVRAGVYLKSLYDFNSSEFSYNVDFWLWFLYDNDSIDPINEIEITNAKKFLFSEASTEKIGEEIWSSQNCKAEINQKWDLTHYPFDRQKLEIVVEEWNKDIKKVILFPQNGSFNYNNEIDIKGWAVDSVRVKNGISKYTTNFGDPRLNKDTSEYSNVSFTIHLSRDSWALFFKLFTGCFVAFFVSFLTFFVRPIHVDPRFGLSIGGLFAAVGNKYVVESNMPDSISFTLEDKIHNLTFVYILVILLLGIISLKIFEKYSQNAARKFDKISAFSVGISYLLLGSIFILQAVFS
jgi:hypothetical protein